MRMRGALSFPFIRFEYPHATLIYRLRPFHSYPPPTTWRVVFSWTSRPNGLIAGAPPSGKGCVSTARRSPIGRRSREGALFPLSIPLSQQEAIKLERRFFRGLMYFFIRLGFLLSKEGGWKNLKRIFLSFYNFYFLSFEKLWMTSRYKKAWWWCRHRFYFNFFFAFGQRAVLFAGTQAAHF